MPELAYPGVNMASLKEIVWAGSSKKDIGELPEEVKDEIGQALFEVQCGLTPASAKPLKGFGGASVLEIREHYQSDTYRAVYTVRFAEYVYVLHVF